mgnify:CR=1 FL=1
MLQRIDLIGNLVADAEEKTGADGRAFISFRVAVNDQSSDEKKTTYYDGTSSRVNLAQYLKKGKQVFASGKLTLSVSQKDSKAYLNAYVSAKEVEMLG